MLFAKAPHQVLYNKDLTPLERCLLIHLIDVQGKNEASWWTQERIATKLGVSLRAVSGAVKSLELRGDIECERVRGRTGAKLTYKVINIDFIKKESNKNKDLEDSANSAQCANSAQDKILPCANFALPSTQNLRALYIEEPDQLEPEEEERIPPYPQVAASRPDADGGLQDAGLEKPEPTPKTSKPPPQDQLAEAFEVFWQAYPRQRRGNRDKAFRAYRRAIEGGRATPEEIQQGVENYGKSSEVSRGFAKGCEAWLNSDGWGNDYRPPANSAASSASGKPGTGDDYFAKILRAADQALDFGSPPRGVRSERNQGSCGNLPIEAVPDTETDQYATPAIGRSFAPRRA